MAEWEGRRAFTLQQAASKHSFAWWLWHTCESQPSLQSARKVTAVLSDF